MHRVDAIVFLASFTVALSGVVQVSLGIGQLGRLVVNVSYRVVAGFMNGVAILAGDARNAWFEDTDRALEAAELALVADEPGRRACARS